MNILPYEVKRAHWGMNTTSMRRIRLEADHRTELRRMTPVRFDILFLMMQRAEAYGAKPGDEIGISLGELIIKLGFDKSTIARSVRHMEEIGYVRRIQDTVDRRQTIVIMRNAGRRAMRTMLELLRMRPDFLTERIGYWLSVVEEDLVMWHEVYAARFRLLARLFDQWAYPIYACDHDPLAVYQMEWAYPPPFRDGAMLAPAPS